MQKSPSMSSRKKLPHLLDRKVCTVDTTPTIMITKAKRVAAVYFAMYSN
jgi:hypothetical protein